MPTERVNEVRSIISSLAAPALAASLLSLVIYVTQAETAETRSNFKTINAEIDDHGKRLNRIEAGHAVIRSQLDNIDSDLEKQDRKLDKILDSVQRLWLPLYDAQKPTSKPQLRGKPKERGEEANGY